MTFHDENDPPLHLLPSDVRVDVTDMQVDVTDAICFVNDAH
jgi:hypothetical protein